MSAYSDRVIADGASYYWRLGEIAGTTAVAAVGGVNGTISGGVTLGATGALSSDANTAMTFNGTSGKITTASIVIPAAVTHEVWIKTSTAGSQKHFLSTAAFANYFIFYLDTGGHLHIYNNGGGPAIDLASIGLINDGVWHHAVATLNGTTCALYIDGAVDNTGSLPNGGATTAIEIGGDSSNFWAGGIDEVAVYPRALTAPEVAAHYTIGTTVTPPVFPTANLVSYWTLDEASGTRQDSHGTNHLTPTNAPVGAAGKIGNGCDLESSSSQYLSHADPLPLGDEDWTYSLWLKFESVDSYQALLVKGDDGANRYLTIYFNVPDGKLWCTFEAASGATVLSPPVNNTNWHWMAIWNDHTAKTINVQIDNGTVQSTVWITYTAPAVNSPVMFGARPIGQYFDGLIDEVGLWRRVLTAQERTDLYNGGAGLAYSTGSGGAGIRTLSLGYWKQAWHAA